MTWVQWLVLAALFLVTLMAYARGALARTDVHPDLSGDPRFDTLAESWCRTDTDKTQQ